MFDEPSDDGPRGDHDHPPGSTETPIEPWVLVALSLVGVAVLVAFTSF